jgi:3-oxoacyl-[acyl-carrier protein] reductase
LDLSGRSIVVAGAGGGGIGTAVSGMLAAAGALVVGVDNRPEALDDFIAVTSKVDGREHPALVADLRQPAEVERVVAAASMPLTAVPMPPPPAPATTMDLPDRSK